jgi:hypothetical protein
MNIKTKIYSIVIASIIAAMGISINPFAFGQSTIANQTGISNMTSSTTSNSTANNSSSVCNNAGETEIGAAIQSFLFRDNNGALMHMDKAGKTLTGAPKMHLDEAIKALQTGDTDLAKIRLQQSMYACGVPDIL